MKNIVKTIIPVFMHITLVSLVGQEIQKSVISGGSTVWSTATVTLNGTIGEPLTGLVQQKNAISQGFWGGGLFVEVLSNPPLFDDVVVYPNPVEFDLNISTGESAIVGATLFSMNGQKVYSKVLERSEVNHTIDLSHLANGSYVLQVHAETTNETKKFKIIKR